ncbi:ComEC/Rec2 family competence protein [Parerythrobacter lacustris]|uniref:MBL fold metallo-hydrolase n=1 Tax=Parerythrobacter lacustris TaxID=2969984 RepID=A0ABT1XLM3_9SPHN|nr:hypothetical protein [Parerythrobacter lacustris]MCR2832563.1 hypothetical protein [Parerythrobacter lacustris]
MADEFETGEEVYAGYPTAHVYTIGRDTKTRKVTLKTAKHLLWGDWTEVSDYDFIGSGDGDKLKPPLAAAEHAEVQAKIAGMVPVRVRGVSGYMYPQDLQRERLLEVVFVDVGQGDGALLVTPDDRKYVIDAGEGDNMYRYLRWRFRNFEKAHTDFDGLIITHPDMDHYEGFRRLFEDGAVHASNVWHNGIVEQFGVSAAGDQSSATDHLLGKRETANGQSYIVDLATDDAKLGALLADPKRWVKTSTGKPKMYPALLNTARTGLDADGARRFPNIAMLSTAHGEISGGRSYLPGFAPGNLTECVIEVVGPAVEPAADGTPRLRTFGGEPAAKTTAMDSGKTKNGHSILLRLTYRDVTLLFGGDLNSPAECYLMSRAAGGDYIEPEKLTAPQRAAVRQSVRARYGADVAKACHHGSADFTDLFLSAINPAATVISSGDEESHAHPRCDTLGAVGLHGRGERPLIFSTELSRSTLEFTKREDTPWFQAAKLRGKLAATTDPAQRAELETEIARLEEEEKKTNVTVYGSINLRSDGRKVVLAYMLEKPSDSRRWDVYPLETDTLTGKLTYLERGRAEEAEEARRRAAGGGG